MTQQEAMVHIRSALNKALERDDIEFDLNTDFFKEELLDSLDGIVFFMELSSLTGCDFPEDIDLLKVGLFKVRCLVDFLTGKTRIEDLLTA